MIENKKLLEIDDLDVYILSKNQNASIAESRKQIKEGKYLTNEEVNREINKLLDK